MPIPSEIFATSGGHRWRWIAAAPGAWLTVGASLVLSLIGVYGIHLADGAGLAARAPVGEAQKQILFLGVGLISAAIAVLPNYRLLGYFAAPLAIVMVGALVFLLIPFVPAWLVKPRNGARSWIDLGKINVQPSELAKIVFVLVLAWYLRFRDDHRTLFGLVRAALIAAVPIALITLQPDLGTALLFVPALFAMLVAAGMRIKHLVLIVLVAALAAPAAYPLLLPHQKARIVGLIRQFEGDASADRDINMQGTTAQRLIGAGGAIGQTGPKAETLLKYNPLPERDNDMIFSVIAGRFGMLGTLVVLGCYVVWMLGAFMTAGGTREPFGRLIAVGLAAFIGAQAFVNIGMNVGVLPIIGITLPYLSYGGSSLVTVWIMTGLVLNVGLRGTRPLMRESFDFREGQG